MIFYGRAELPPALFSKDGKDRGIHPKNRRILKLKRAVFNAGYRFRTTCLLIRKN
jgi:hypothetical protein